MKTSAKLPAVLHYLFQVHNIEADVKLPARFNHHMVIRQNDTLPVSPLMTGST